MSATPSLGVAPNRAQPWYREVTTEQWKAFWAAYLGWMLDAFDFTILTFLVVDIQRSFTVNNALAGALGSVTLAFRVAGGIASGTAADRWGRKFPLMFSIVWYSAFAFLGGFATSYRVLFALRALFGIGMGGVWAAGMPLALEHSPPRLRGIASGMLQSGYSAGSILSALAYTYAYPLVNREDIGGRVMLWIGVAPAIMVFWIMRGVKESPVWLERQRHLSDTGTRDGLSLRRLFHADSSRTTLHASLVLGTGLAFYHSMAYWYPTFLQANGHRVLPFLVATRDLGSVIGTIACGRLSETALVLRRQPVSRRRRRDDSAILVRRKHGRVALWRVRDGIFLRGDVWRGAHLFERTIPHSGASRRGRVCLPRWRGCRVCDAVHYWRPGRSRHVAAGGHGLVYCGVWCADDWSAAPRPRDTRPRVSRARLISTDKAV